MTEPINPTMITKKLCNMIRAAFLTVQKGVSNSRKRGKILGKALNDLVLDHHSNFSCQSHDLQMSFVSPVSCRPSDADLSFVSPREYEFSCSGSPPRQPYKLHASRRRTHYSRKHHTHYHPPPYIWADDAASEGGDTGGASSLVGQRFGWSPLVRQVRITDSPYQVRGGDGDHEGCLVDMEAEKFIQRFYRELRLQKWMAAQETSYYHG